jgi:hypothetical protein
MDIVNVFSKLNLSAFPVEFAAYLVRDKILQDPSSSDSKPDPPTAANLVIFK